MEIFQVAAWVANSAVLATSVLVGASDPFDELAVAEGGSSAHEGNELGCVDRAPAAEAASMSLWAIASPAAREPGPLAMRSGG